MGLCVEGTMGYYARSTAVDWQTCEEIESVRAEALRKRGIASGEPRVQVHAPRAAGGMGAVDLVMNALYRLIEVELNPLTHRFVLTPRRNLRRELMS